MLNIIWLLLMVVGLLCFCFTWFQISMNFWSNFGRISANFRPNFVWKFKFWFCNFVRYFAKIFEINFVQGRKKWQTEIQNAGLDYQQTVEAAGITVCSFQMSMRPQMVWIQVNLHLALGIGDGASFFSTAESKILKFLTSSVSAVKLTLGLISSIMNAGGQAMQWLQPETGLLCSACKPWWFFAQLETANIIHLQALAVTEFEHMSFQ